jgi:hypothetical protein
VGGAASVVAVTWAIGGCTSLSGSWRTVSIDPPTEPFFIDAATFDDRDHFTATTVTEGERHTTTGRYEFNGFTLSLMPHQGPAQRFSARITSSGRLILTQRRDRERVSATLVRAAD